MTKISLSQWQHNEEEKETDVSELVPFESENDLANLNDWQLVQYSETFRDAALALLDTTDHLSRMDYRAQVQAVGKLLTSRIRDRAMRREASNNIVEVILRTDRRTGIDIPQWQGEGILAKTGDFQSNQYGSLPEVMTLSDIGFTRKQSSLWQKLARIPQDIFEDYIATAQENLWEMTTAGLVRWARQTSTILEDVPFGDVQPHLYVGRAEAMDVLERGSIDLIITSPPYNLGEASWPLGGGESVESGGTGGRTRRETGIGYSDNQNEEGYQDWQLDCLIEFYRVAKVGASLFYNHKARNREGQLIHPLSWLLSPRNPWTLRQEIIWWRGSTHNHNPMLFWPEDERIYWFTKAKPMLPEHPIGKSTVWHEFGPIPNQSWHPAPFTPELPRMILEAIGRPGIVVLDPFAGSCTTIKVALEMGYEAIGIDISEEYLTRAAKENGWTIRSST